MSLTSRSSWPIRSRSSATFAFTLLTVLALNTHRAFAVPCYSIERLFCTYANDPEAMVQDIGPIRVSTNFQTWPDGTATIPGQQLTQDVNYTSIGVTFSAPISSPFMGVSGTSRVLEVDSGGFERDWIIADLIVPARAVAILFPAGTTLYAYDGNGNVITSVSYDFPGAQNLFLGITSDVPIARAVVDEGSSGDIIDAFGFNPIPEPSSVTLVAIAMTLTPRRRRR